MQQQIFDSDQTESTKTLIKSFDSSQIFSYPSRTQSIQSSQHKQSIFPLSTYLDATANSLDNQLPQVQSVRFHNQKQPQFSQDFSFHSIGFVYGKQKKPIQMNIGKLKKSKNFFDDTPPQSQEQNQIENNTIAYFQPLKNDKYQLQELSVPCFKTGRNGNVSINDQLLSKAKCFLDQQKYEMSNKKPTKLKKDAQHIVQNDYIKTANFKTRTFDASNKKVIKQKRQAFDWIQYQKKVQNIILNKSNTFDTFSKQKYFRSLKLKDLSIQTVKQNFKIQQFQQKIKSIYVSFSHFKNSCSITGCLLCSIDWNSQQISVQQLHQIFVKKLTISPLSYQKFIQIYSQVYCKLLKYEIFHPQISNKQLNPSVILYQIFKKQKKIQKQRYKGWINIILQQNNHYNGFIGYVKDKYYFEKMNIYFIQLSDGWSTVWVAIQKSNLLYSYVAKIKLCAKIFVSFWTSYPLSNILTYCPKAKASQRCIQMYYNSTIMLNQNIKLGKSKLLFYRPLNKCKKNGGIVTTVEGVIIRMFYLKQSKKQLKAISMRQNYLQILTPEGFTILIRFLLSQQNTLAEMFRLYYNYHFYYLKIGNDNNLSFVLPHSKFFELPSSKKHVYSQNLINLLKKRYVNSMNQKNIFNLKVGECYDIKIQNNNLETLKENYKIRIQDQCLGKGVAVYQQLVLSLKDDQHKLIVLKKHNFSNSLRSFPKIYNLLSQSQ